VARLEFANALRGLAALSVVTSHYNSFFFGSAALIGAMANTPPPTHVASTALEAWHAFLLLFPFVGGEFGVALFFLISGFVIPMSLQKYDWRGFLVGRVLRIYPTYFAGFAVTLLALWIAGRTFGKPFPYEARSVIIHFVPGLRDLLWSVNIDYVVWTLEVEVKFYLVCAIAWKWLRLGDRRVFAIPLALAVCTIGIEALLPGWLQASAYASQIAYRLGNHLSMTSRFLAFMFIGVAIFYHYRRRLGTVALCAVSAMLYCVFWIQWSNAPNSAESLSMLVVNSYTLALFTFFVSYAFSSRWPASRVLGFFADISFPLYVVHGVAGYVALGIMAAHGVSPIVALGCTLAGALLVSTLLHVGVELPTHRLGQRWARALTRVEDDRPVSPTSAPG
jgi:peptidoglycan/LPS O-acetylase OafA/YrhL